MIVLRRLGLGWCLVGALLWGCGDDDNGGGPAPAETNDGSKDQNADGRADGGAEDNSGDGSLGNNPPGNGQTPPGSTPSGSPPSLPDPILPEVEGDTPLSELEEDEADQVCQAYMDSAKQMLERSEALCSLAGLSVLQEMDSPTDEEFRTACNEARESCRLESQGGAQALANAQCGDASECAATVDQFNECQLMMHRLDALVLGPLSSIEVADCNDMSAQQARMKSDEVLVALLPALLSEELVALLEEGNACEVIDEQCPGYAIPTDSFQPPL